MFVITDSGQQPRFHLPWDYHLSVQSFIYDAVEAYEPELAEELHSQNHAPPFSYSQFIQTGDYSTDSDGIACEAGYWIFNTDDVRIIDALANHARAGELTVGHTTVPVVGTELKETHGVTEAWYRSVSPIYISRWRDDRRESLLPEDDAWATELRRSVKNRLEHREGLPDDFRLDVGEVHRWKQKSLRITKDRWYKCARCEVTLRTDRTTSEFIQKYGSGKRRAWG